MLDTTRGRGVLGSGRAPDGGPPRFLDLLTPADRALLRWHASTERHLPGALLLAQGSACGHLWILVEGIAEEEHVTVDGQKLTLARFGPGDVIGLAEVTSGTPALCSVRARSTSEALALTTAVWQRVQSRRAGIGVAALTVLSTRLRASESGRVAASTARSTARVTYGLLQLALHDGMSSTEGTVVRCTQTDLAAWTGLSRESTVKGLRDLRDAGVVTTGRGCVTIRDLALLRDSAPSIW